MNEELNKAYDKIIAEIRDRQKVRLRENKIDEERIQTLLGTRASFENTQETLQSTCRESWNNEKTEQLIAEFSKKVEVEEQNLSRALRMLVTLLPHGQEYTCGFLLPLVRKASPSLVPKTEQPMKSFTSTVHAISEKLIEKGQVEKVSSGRGAGNETVYRRIVTNGHSLAR